MLFYNKLSTVSTDFSTDQFLYITAHFCFLLHYFENTVPFLQNDKIYIILQFLTYAQNIFSISFHNNNFMQDFRTDFQK